MTPPKGFCAHCGLMVEHNQSAAYQVWGIELERKQGGANQIRHKERIDGWIVHNRHDKDCLHQWVRRREVQGEQTSLV